MSANPHWARAAGDRWRLERGPVPTTRRSARFDIREEVDDIREEVDDIREEVDDRSQVEGELEHAELCAGEGDKNDAMRDRFIEELRHEMATVDKLPPECIDREIITVLQMSIANLQAERFGWERLLAGIVGDKNLLARMLQDKEQYGRIERANEKGGAAITVREQRDLGTGPPQSVRRSQTQNA